MIKQKFNKTLYHDIFRLEQMILNNGSQKNLENFIILIQFNILFQKAGSNLARSCEVQFVIHFRFS